VFLESVHYVIVIVASSSGTLPSDSGLCPAMIFSSQAYPWDWKDYTCTCQSYLICSQALRFGSGSDR